MKRAYYAKLGHQLCTTLLFEHQNAPSASNIYPLLHIKSHKCLPCRHIHVLRTNKNPEREARRAPCSQQKVHPSHVLFYFLHQDRCGSNKDHVHRIIFSLMDKANTFARLLILSLLPFVAI